MAMIELVDFNEIYGKSVETAAEPAKKTRRAGGTKAKAASTNDVNSISDAEVVTDEATSKDSATEEKSEA
jgi:large subunit ribosomal protein L17